MGIPWYETLNLISGRNLGRFNRAMWGSRPRHNINAWRNQPHYSKWKRFFSKHWSKTGGKPTRYKDWVRKPHRMKDSMGREAQARTRAKLRQYGMSKTQATALTRFLAMATAAGAGYLGTQAYSRMPKPGFMPDDFGDLTPERIGPLGSYLGGAFTPMWKRRKRYSKILSAIDYGYRYNRRYSRYGY
ncbi:MAG TPA: hypothetical protein DEP04_05700 [Dehalococcoidia bacterium]|nr:hypothetical protein [Dehalococcoidia bacterium]